MIHTTTIKMPYPLRWGIFYIPLKRKVSFSFDNFALFLFRERQKTLTPEDLAKWQNEHTKIEQLIHVAYAAAESYCLHNRLKFDLDLKKFATGLALMDKSELERLIEVWKNSQEYGAAVPPGKKKAKVKR